MNKIAQFSVNLLFVLVITVFTGCEQNDIDPGLSDYSANGTVNGSNPTTDSNEAVVESATGNEYPVVLLHGFIGWGRDEVGGPLGHYYWGGYNDLQEILKKSGIDCYTAVVGPFSSNYDRACELYAQLKGTKTDYGLAHSVKHKHNRFGLDFTGKALLSSWGAAGKNRKVHILAHSQGALTARVFAQLIEQGSVDEQKADYKGVEPVSPFLSGSGETKNMVCSVSTLAGVHNGTTLANGVVKLIPFIQQLLVTMLEGIGVDANNTVFNIYDFKLQQFGLKSRQKGESLNDYFTRVGKAAQGYFDTDMKDICLWDLSPEGCMEQNAWVHAQSNIYYFSYAGISSHQSKSILMRDNGEYYHVPDSSNFAAWYITGPMMGAYTCNDDRYHGYWRAQNGDFYHMPVADRVPTDSKWWPNDGVVNTISMNGPWLYPEDYKGVRDVIVDWNGTRIPDKGVWNYYGVLKGFDHFDITGVEIFTWDFDNHPKNVISHIEDWYIERAEFLHTLPQ